MTKISYDQFAELSAPLGKAGIVLTPGTKESRKQALACSAKATQERFNLLLRSLRHRRISRALSIDLSDKDQVLAHSAISKFNRPDLWR